MPDLILSLYSNKEKIKEFSVAGGREFELNDEFLQKQVDLNTVHDNYFRKLNKSNIKFIDRSDLDYRDNEQLDVVLELVKDSLGL